MDALALLCTLHADGPTSLKRLRTGGCGTISALVERAPEDVAEMLEIERAVARRLLREARILSERIGVGSLDVEEAPAALGRNGARGSEAEGADAIPSVAPAPQTSELDAVDRALVARVSLPQPMEEIRASEPIPAPVELPPVPEPIAAEPEPVAVPETPVEPEPVAELDQHAQQEQHEVVEAPSRPGARRAGTLPGRDEGMVEDLERLEISTFEELGRADSLTLTRGLGITFAQARRLRFLARRAAEEQDLERWTPDAPALEPVQVAVAPPLPVESVDVVEPVEPVEPAAPAAAVAAELEPDPEQGVRVDPSEIAARPTFAEQFARAAAERRATETTHPGAGTVLGWNFEIPRPEPDALPFASISPDAHVRPSEGAGDAHGAPAEAPPQPSFPEDDIAGPFARS